MAVLMTYHKLVERDEKQIDLYWKGLIVALLLIAAACCMGSSLSLQKVIKSYDNKCLLGTTLYFDAPSSSALLLQQQVNETATTLSLDYSINELTTKWSKKSKCDFGIYIPIAQCCFSLIMLTMFLICGRGGNSGPQAFLPQPWRIVTPALFFFLVMSIVTITNLTIVEGGLATFCRSFENILPNASCSEAINRFAYTESDSSSSSLQPDVLKTLLAAFDWSLLVCWLLSVLLMLARILLVIDFKLVRVTVRTVEYEKAATSEEAEQMQVVSVENDSLVYTILNDQDSTLSLKTIKSE